jgi:hypothetical protein
VRANVQILIALFTHWFFMFQTILSKLRKWKKYGINSGIDRQIHAGITSEMLPPFGPYLTLFRHPNLDFLHLIIAGFTGRFLLPHFVKESQPPLEHFFKNEYFYLSPCYWFWGQANIT